MRSSFLAVYSGINGMNGMKAYSAKANTIAIASGTEVSTEGGRDGMLTKSPLLVMAHQSDELVDLHSISHLVSHSASHYIPLAFAAIIPPNHDFSSTQ